MGSINYYRLENWINKFQAGVSKINNNNMEPLKLFQISEFINEEEIVSFISKKLNSIIAFNESNNVQQKRGAKEYTHSSFIPVISIEGFLKLILKYAEIENNTLIVSYLNIIKLINKENFILTNNNVYILLLASCTLSKKFLEDLILENSYYCQIGQFTAEELNLAECSLFCKLDFNINYSVEEVEEVYREIFATLSNQRKQEFFIKANNYI